VELYIVMPIRLSLNPDFVPNVRVVDMWALGIIYAKIVLHANRLRPLNRITAGFNHVRFNSRVFCYVPNYGFP